MPGNKKNRRKERQKKRRAQEKTEKPRKPRMGVIAHSGTPALALAALIGGIHRKGKSHD